MLLKKLKELDPLSDFLNLFKQDNHVNIDELCLKIELYKCFINNHKDHTNSTLDRINSIIENDFNDAE